MLKLKKLQILGFKSFCDRTELKFHGDGIAAIVGPNGCGKSNIADAISWVLGEQSAKSLRGSRMEDVIFAGTGARKPTGMAEVSLTLIDPDNYEGGTTDELEVEVQEELPQDDWDEEAVRAAGMEEAERIAAELQPGQKEEEVEGGAAPAPEGAAAEGGVTEVVLKIRRRKLRPRQFKAGEMVVTRRLFRSGESEYLLNGKLCRLRDIQDIFLGTGLGPESYAIIEQGRIGQILSSKPHDRRAIIEEAAGITKFKTKKRLAEARLEQAQQNLARVNDIFEEVTRQMNSLKRQANKAERYVKLREEMRGKLRVVLASKFAQLEAETASLQAELERLAEELRLKGEAVQQRESEFQQRTQHGYAIQEEIRAHGEKLNQAAIEIDRARRQQQSNEERCAELESRAAAEAAELERTEAQHASLQAELAANQTVVDSAAADVLAAQQRAAEEQQAAAQATARLAEVEQLLERTRLEIIQVVAAAAELRNQATQAEEHVAGLDREAQRLSGEMQAALNEVETFGGQRGQLALSFESATQRVNALARHIEEGRAGLEQARASESEAKRRLDGLRAEFATALGKKGSLESVIAEYGYSTESVKRLFQSGAVERGFAPVGVLADFLEVDDQYESVIEDFLRDELNYVVVKSWDAADQGLQLLRSDVDGRATFLVHPEDSQARFSFLVDEATRPAPPRGSIVPLKGCIRVLNGFGKSLEVILPKLRDGYITPDAAVARDLALENPDAFFLAASGECFHNVTVTGGRQRAEGPLSMKRELREVARQVEELERAVSAEELQVQELARQISELTSLLSRLEEEKREADREAMTSGHRLGQVDADMARAQERIGIFRQELQRLAGERAEKEALIAGRREQMEAQERQRQMLESAVAEAQARLPELRATRDGAAQAAAEASARVAALEERRIAAAGALGRIQTLAAEVSGRVAALRAQIQAAAEETERRRAMNVQLAEQLLVFAGEKAAAEQRATELRAEADELRLRLAEVEEQLRGLRQELDAARDRRGELSASVARLQSDRQHMAETCLNELGVTAEQLLGDSSLLRLTGEELAAEDGLHREMRTRLENMGPVNMMALEEYNETAQRHAFLETQRKDLLDSIENTQNTIKEIDTFSRQRFQEAFARINENFQMSFRKLFGGGQAFMRLTDEENTAESGIDVVASPPGKKLQNVLLLSGGEKALTALALLVGIFQYQPSPFCVLDEVDAPLDEANVGRFTELVRDLSMQTQFVLITHNKRTMSMAPVMYGITMQEPGVSKLVSVRFGEAAAPA